MAQTKSTQQSRHPTQRPFPLFSWYLLNPLTRTAAGPKKQKVGPFGAAAFVKLRRWRSSVGNRAAPASPFPFGNSPGFGWLAGGFDAHGRMLLFYLFRWVWIGEKREDKDEKREDATKRHNHSPHHRPQARTKPVREIFGSLECIDDAAVLVVVTLLLGVLRSATLLVMGTIDDHGEERHRSIAYGGSPPPAGGGPPYQPPRTSSEPRLAASCGRQLASVCHSLPSVMRSTSTIRRLRRSRSSEETSARACDER